MVGVQDYMHSILLSHLMHMLSARYCTSYRSSLLRIVQALACKEIRDTVRKLNDHRRVDLSGSFQYGIDRVSINNIYSRKGKLLFLSIVQQLLGFLSV